MTTETLDLKGLNCPLPILRANDAIKKMPSGEVLEVLTTDPGSIADFDAFCRATGHELMESGEDDGVYRFLIKSNS